jgi:hypothetical protein
MKHNQSYPFHTKKELEMIDNFISTFHKIKRIEDMHQLNSPTQNKVDVQPRFMTNHIGCH